MEYEKDNPFGLEIESDFHLTRRNVTVSLIRSFFNKKIINILDVGCGKGLITRHLNDSFPNAKIDAIDISEKAIKYAKEIKCNINFLVSNAELFKGFEYNYDAIILNNIYEHVENPILIIKNVKKNLRKME